MGTLIYNLTDETLYGSLTDDHTEEVNVSIESEVTGDCSETSVVAGLEVGTNVRVNVTDHEVAVEPSDLSGDATEQMNFGLGLMAQAFQDKHSAWEKAINEVAEQQRLAIDLGAQADALRARVGVAERIANDLRAQLAQRKPVAPRYSPDGASATLQKVWGAVTEYLDAELPVETAKPFESYAQGYALAKARARNALRDLGLEPETETVVVTDD